jgi:hypothetical protein
MAGPFRSDLGHTRPHTVSAEQPSVAASFCRWTCEPDSTCAQLHSHLLTASDLEECDTGDEAGSVTP